MVPGSPTFEFRAWAERFPGLPELGDEPFQDETYILPLGLPGRNIKLRGDALEIKDLIGEQDGLQIWQPAARLPFPIPAALVERELLVRLALSEPLEREHYDAGQLLALIAERRRNVAVVGIAKRRRQLEVAGSRAEVAEVEVAGQRVRSAAVEHEDAARVRRAVAELGLEAHANVDYPAMLARLTGAGAR